MKVRRHLTRLLAVAIVAIAAAACGSKEEPEFIMGVRYPTVDGEAGNQFVIVSTASTQTWTLTLTDDSGATPDWAAIDPATGVGSKSSIALSWTRNGTGQMRTIIITGVCGSQSKSVAITQLAYESQSGGGGQSFPAEITSDPVPAWLELPATDNPNLYFITHDSEVNKCGRNFSYYWDVDNLVAHWVAYPLNSSLAGSGSRTDAWDYDPKLPKNAQPELYRGYRMGSPGTSSDGGSSWWDRGHQCPSADRLAYKDNIQTFYFTNMTPQNGNLNQNIWASLETKVRDWSKVFDTLYVATGCVVKGSTAFAYDNQGKKVTAPVGYYKALLGYQKSRAVGITSQTYGYTGVAFYFENSNYTGTGYMSQAMTIDELEAKVGVDFFVNLPKVIDQALADKVESTRDNFWWNGK